MRQNWIWRNRFKKLSSFIAVMAVWFSPVLCCCFFITFSFACYFLSCKTGFKTFKKYSCLLSTNIYKLLTSSNFIEASKTRVLFTVCVVQHGATMWTYPRRSLLQTLSFPACLLVVTHNRDKLPWQGMWVACYIKHNADTHTHRQMLLRLPHSCHATVLSFI